MINKNTCYSRSEPDVGQHSRSSHGVAVLLVNDDVVYQLDAYAVQRGGGTAGRRYVSRRRQKYSVRVAVREDYLSA